jgi:hypothetical protein
LQGFSVKVNKRQTVHKSLKFTSLMIHISGDVSVIPKKNDIDKTGINDDIERYEQQSITGKRQKPKRLPP